jgi:hypothetical protein
MDIRNQIKARGASPCHNGGAIMFYLEYENGYVVTAMVHDGFGYRREKPLRKFRYQGDAMVFRDHDCPKLTEGQISALIRLYDPDTIYHRISENKFVKLT